MELVADPKSVKVNKTAGTGMDIEWKDGHQSAYSFVFLRDACPCALCQDEREKDGRQPGDPLKPVAGTLPMFKALARPTEVGARGQVRHPLHLERRPSARYLLVGIFARALPVPGLQGAAFDGRDCQRKQAELIVGRNELRKPDLSHLSQLNPQQREAVETATGPVLILAGAGSGKTRVITYRIAHLIDEVDAWRPTRFLRSPSPTRRPARWPAGWSQLVGARTLAKPLIATFHSFCVRLLRRDIETLQIAGKGYRKDFAIYDESDQQSVVKAAMRRLGLDTKQQTPRSVLSHISWAKNHMRDPQEVYLESADPRTERVAQIYEIYKQELAKSNALDFDDLLLYAVRVLKASGETRDRYNRRYRHILVDEYQDTNRPQYELMRMLAGEEHNVCAVGDEDQSIYSWRGADIRNILEFEQDFPEARIIRLEQNYRSTQNILQAASAVVANNVRRKGKNLWTDRTGGAKIGYYEAPDGENEALFAADYIAKYLAKAGEEGGHEPRAAVLYRTNSQSRLLEEAMRRYQLKYHVVGGFSFYERSEIKDMISYLKAIQNPDDSVAIQRVINTPARGIGKSTTETLERIALETGISLWGAIQEALQRDLLPAAGAGRA